MKCDPTYKYYYIKVVEELKNGQAKHSVERESRGSHQTVKAVKLCPLHNAKL
jgi:hypothetical protein